MEKFTSTIDFLSTFRFPARDLLYISAHLPADFLENPPKIKVTESESLDVIARLSFDKIPHRTVIKLEKQLMENENFHMAVQHLIYRYVIQDYSVDIIYEQHHIPDIIRTLVAIVISFTIQINSVVPKNLILPSIESVVGLTFPIQ